MADLVLYAAAVLVVIVVLLAIPTMMRADRETLDALDRVLAQHHGHVEVGSMPQQQPAEHHPADRPVQHAA